MVKKKRKIKDEKVPGMYKMKSDPELSLFFKSRAPPTWTGVKVVLSEACNCTFWTLGWCLCHRLDVRKH